MCLPTNDLRFVQLPRPLRERIFGRATAKPSPYGRDGRGQIFRIGTSTADWKVEYKNSDENPNNPRQRAGVWGKTPRHSEALAEESQGFNTPCRPEFISGPYQFSIGLQASKMLNQVQHDIIFLSLRRGIKGEVTS